MRFSQVGDERVLEIRHEDPRARIERVDHHLAIRGTGNLDAPVEEIVRESARCCHSDSRMSARAGQKIGSLARFDARLRATRACSSSVNAAAKLRVQRRKKLERFGGENRLEIRARRRRDLERFGPLPCGNIHSDPRYAHQNTGAERALCKTKLARLTRVSAIGATVLAVLGNK